MFNEGNILYFTPFSFKNGNPAKAKYFIVLKNIGNSIVLASLPTSKDFIPKMYEKNEGCIEVSEINMNCFVISPNKPITVCNKCFEFTTFIYGFQIDSYELSLLNEIYPRKNVDYQVFGAMKSEFFNELIVCLKNSKSVKRKFVNLLS